MAKIIRNWRWLTGVRQRSANKWIDDSGNKLLHELLQNRVTESQYDIFAIRCAPASHSVRWCNAMFRILVNSFLRNPFDWQTSCSFLSNELQRYRFNIQLVEIFSIYLNSLEQMPPSVVYWVRSNDYGLRVYAPHIFSIVAVCYIYPHNCGVFHFSAMFI